jgi:hypothetical protein
VSTAIYDFTGPKAKARVRELLQVSQEINSRRAQELADQRKRELDRKAEQALAEVGRRYPRDQKRTRTFLDTEAAKRKKYAIETGFDEETQAYRAAPLEPWTGPAGSQRVYQRIMFSDPVSITGYQAGELAAVEWMREEGLAGVDDDGLVRPLSDSRPAERRAYPGAPVKDTCRKVNGAHTCTDGKHCAGFGRYLREHGRGLVLAAMANLMRHMPVGKVNRRKLALADRKHGMSLSAYDVTAEANAVKSKRPDLDEFRYLSVATVRSWLNDMLAAGDLHEAEPPKALRIQRSWRTLPRVFETRITDASTVPLRGTP